MAEHRIDAGTLSDFRKMYMPRAVVESRFMKSEKKYKRLREETRFLNEERKKTEERLLELPSILVDKESYNNEKQLFANKKDMKDLVISMDSLASEDDLIKQYAQLRTSIQQVTRKMDETFATKADLANEIKLVTEQCERIYNTKAA